MEKITLGLAMLAFLICGDAIFGGIYLYKIKGFLVRFIPSIALYVVAYMAGHSDASSEIPTKYVVGFIIVAVIAIAVSFYDMFRIVIRADDLHRHRNRGHHRTTTPTKH
jgi:hypothetical protein